MFMLETSHNVDDLAAWFSSMGSWGIKLLHLTSPGYQGAAWREKELTIDADIAIGGQAMNDAKNDEEQWNQGKQTLGEDKVEQSDNKIWRQLKETFESECRFNY